MLSLYCKNILLSNGSFLADISENIYIVVSPANTMQVLAAAGVSHVFECGPGKVLTGLVKRCNDNLLGSALVDLAGIEAALATVKG